MKFEIVYQLETGTSKGSVEADSIEEAQKLARAKGVKMKASALYVVMDPEQFEKIKEKKC